ncbi:MAG: hypothetical protein JSV36_02105 [Anaerolineae bacterium]|nr:MAG: hypothetical protein JSV36_02105 [Anaerolineae bacterium]
MTTRAHRVLGTLLAVLWAVALGGCAGRATSTAVPSEAVQPTHTLAAKATATLPPTATSSPMATPTQAPRATHTPSPEPTPAWTPTASPSPTAPATREPAATRPASQAVGGEATRRQGTLVPPLLDGLPPGLVYRFEDALWLVQGDGQWTWVADGARAFLSPDGREVIYAGPDDEQGHWLRDRATGRAYRLLHAPHRLACCFRWWPERPGVLLATSLPLGADRLGGEPLGALTAVNADGTGYELLDREYMTWNTAPAPSPDG